MSASHDHVPARTDAREAEHGDRRAWTAPAIRRMSAGIAEAGGSGASDGVIGES